MNQETLGYIKERNQRRREMGLRREMAPIERSVWLQAVSDIDDLTGEIERMQGTQYDDALAESQALLRQYRQYVGAAQFWLAEGKPEEALKMLLEIQPKQELPPRRAPQRWRKASR